MADSRACDAVRMERRGRVGIVTLDRPKVLNALDRESEHSLVDLLALLDADDDVRAIVVTGEGRAFCAGADLTTGGESTFDVESQAELRAKAGTIDGTPRDGGGLITLQIASMRTPVIGAINGAAVGLGVTITLAMDVRIATSTAKFGFPFTRRGIVMEAASSWFLPRIVGISRALDWTLSARMIGAQEALEAGLVSQIVSPGELLPTALGIADQIAECSPVAVAASRQLLWSMAGAPSPWDAHRLESKLLAELGRSDDASEGVRAFLERRTPDFPGRVSQQYPKAAPNWPSRPDDVRDAHDEGHIKQISSTGANE